ncbi:hypothetical protein [Aquibacillus rhizosphaerae]|uniref:Uncharacterized protein n=1 Tax=Aquibacillus rhizosphaerae TaxID=3051431 RepID=A0ABT7L3G2_9BACI|nr:hypothetical protein [Aquibacillus sp. LR5S19]MDL4840405.1 hypothetical protein [Aquibacillus sp. LR5S19]
MKNKNKLIIYLSGVTVVLSLIVHLLPRPFSFLIKPVAPIAIGFIVSKVL